MSKYDAFVSYSHAKDKPLAKQLQHVIQRLGKPWYKRRAARIFRDDTSLTATPELWPTIVEALEQSRYLILLASPEAGHSPWVNKEVDWWLTNKGINTLLIGLTAGNLHWEPTAHSFARMADMPLPPALQGNFTAEPLWIDLREWRNEPAAARKSTQFKSLASKFAARIRGVPPEDLWSEELRQQRATLRLAGGAIAGLVALAALSAYGFIRATNQERIANENNAEAQIQLALAQAERGTTREAIKSAIAGNEIGQNAGLDQSHFEPQLYAVSSKSARGLVAAANISFAAPHATGVEATNLSFQPGGNVICATLSNNTADHGGSFDTCFSFKEELIQWAENLSLKEPHPVTEPIELLPVVTADAVELYVAKGGTEPRRDHVYTLRNEALRQYPADKIDAKKCANQPYIIIKTWKDTPESGFVENFYSLNMSNGRFLQLDGSPTSFACSNTAPILISSERYGNVRVHNLEQGYTAFEPIGTLAREAGTVERVSFSTDGLALFPSMLKLDGTWTNPILAPAYGSWDAEISELSLWRGLPGQLVAMSSDSKYAAILYGEFGTLILTIWDVAGLGITKGTDTDNVDSNTDPDAVVKAAKEGAARMWATVPRPNEIPCATYAGSGSQVIANGSSRVLVYNYEHDKIISDDTGVTFLSAQETENCNHELDFNWSDAKVERTPIETLKAYCARVTFTALDCNFFSTKTMPDWLKNAGLGDGCWLVHKTDRFWICAPDGISGTPQKILTVLDWTNQRTSRINHPFFTHMYESKHSLSHFTIRVNETCGRASFTYENVMTGGGVPQPKGALIVDLTTGSEVAKLDDIFHDVFCSPGDLIKFMKHRLSRYEPRPVHVDKFDFRPNPRE